MDVRRSSYVSCDAYFDPNPLRMTSPTCEDLGIPSNTWEEEEKRRPMYPFVTRRIIHNPSLHLDGLRYLAHTHMSSDSYTPLCMFPFPGAIALHFSTEPSFIRKRNERERERVRCVNEGYARLKEHLPDGSVEKRLNKVDTLRGAIDYIQQLQKLLAENPPGLRGDQQDEDEGDEMTEARAERTTPDSEEILHIQTDGARDKKRSSLSSEQSSVSDGALSDSDGGLAQCVKRQRVC